MNPPTKWLPCRSCRKATAVPTSTQLADALCKKCSPTTRTDAAPTKTPRRARMDAGQDDRNATDLKPRFSSMPKEIWSAIDQHFRDGRARLDGAPLSPEVRETLERIVEIGNGTPRSVLRKTGDVVLAGVAHGALLRMGAAEPPRPRRDGDDEDEAKAQMKRRSLEGKR